MQPVYRSERAPTEDTDGVAMWCDDGAGYVRMAAANSEFAQNCYAFYPNPNPKPEPLVKPKPERIESWALVGRGGGDAVWLWSSSREQAEKHSDGRHTVTHFREVLPGDPTPEAIAEVVEELSHIQSVIGETFTVPTMLKRVARCIAKLEAK